MRKSNFICLGPCYSRGFADRAASSASGDDETRVALCAPDVLARMSDVLRRRFEDNQVKETALWAVTNLTLSSDARALLADGQLRTVLTHLFVEGDPAFRPKAMQAVRNFLVDGAFSPISRVFVVHCHLQYFCAIFPACRLRDQRRPAT